jgi:predicted phage-related endonuclease
MAVLGWSWGSLAALLGGNRLVWFDVERNDRFIAALRVAVAEFWERLLTLTPPPVDASESSRRALTVL